MKRNPTIDILRGIAIFLVVFGHISHIGWTKTYIWGFHIPIFFFISGMLFNENKYNSITNFIKSKFRTLIIPYGIFYLTTFVYWLVIERYTRGGVTPASQLIGLFYGTYNLKYMMFNGALWFIPCLFSIELLYYFIAKIKNNTKIFAGGNLAASNIRNLECPSYEVYLIDYGCGKFNKKVHIME